MAFRKPFFSVARVALMACLTSNNNSAMALKTAVACVLTYIPQSDIAVSTRDGPRGELSIASRQTVKSLSALLTGGLRIDTSGCELSGNYPHKGVV